MVSFLTILSYSINLIVLECFTVFLQMHKVDGSIEFSYEELYDVTNNFSMEH